MREDQGDAITEAVAAMREAWPFAGHAEECRSHVDGPETCDCGSDEAFRRLRAAADALERAGQDTKRLDWLEQDHNAQVYPSLSRDDFGVRVRHQNGDGFATSGKIRDAIDAARAAGGTNG